MVRRSRSIFVSIAAQADNLGDIAIRQVALDMVADAVDACFVYAGSMPESYVQAFDIPANAIVMRSARAFASRLALDVILRRASLMFAPGPLNLSSGVRPATKAIMNLSNVILVRISGGKVVALGRALRGQGQPAAMIERFAIGRYSLFVTRDRVSGERVRRTLRQAPDLAFARRSFASIGTRETVAISLRGDRPVPRQLIERVVEWARKAGLEPVFVTQVRRDEQNHEQLATEYSASHVAWNDNSHRAQLDRVEQAYRNARFVVSDRLHGLIIGSCQGAAPIGIEYADTDKLRSTLTDVVPIHFISPSGDSGMPDPGDPELELLGSATSAARQALDRLGREVQRIIRR